MTTRTQGVVDYYEIMGIEPGATHAEIATRFRALARTLHPDARPVAPESAELFKRVTTAYGVLGDRDRRREYDRIRAARATVTVHAPAAAAPAAAVGAKEPRLTRRGARLAVVGGVVALVLGVVAAVLVISLQRHDASLRSRGIEVTGVVVEVDGERRVEFVGPGGEIVRAPEPLKSGTGRPPVGTEVEIRYDPDDPTEVISSESQLARDLTIWIVAVKLLVGGAVLAGFGAHRLRRTDL
ncbi:MAG TPA: DnaJ domain-containing protein [Acidimicrobiia bacterium]